MLRTDRTFAMIKPDAVEKNLIGKILEKITSSGFRIIGLQMKQLDETNAGKFYSIHEDKPFFKDLVSYITRSPIIIMVLEKSNAVNDFRTLIGATDPQQAAEGTIRKLFATSISENAIHGSDSNENASIEINFHFKESSIF